MRSGRFLSFIQSLIWSISAVGLLREKGMLYLLAHRTKYSPSSLTSPQDCFFHHNPLNSFNYWWRVLPRSRVWFPAWGGLWSPPPPAPPQTWVGWSKFCSSPRHPQWARIPPRCWVGTKDRAQIKSGMITATMCSGQEVVQQTVFLLKWEVVNWEQNKTFFFQV